VKYKLTNDAENDLTDLYVYGFKEFGEEQAEKYFFEIEKCIKLLADTPMMCRERKEFTPSVRIHHHVSHLIIYTIEQEHILVIRVLQNSMDLQRHLNNS